MTRVIPTTLNWQAKTAFACTALFSLASISTNAVYGWSKGDTLPSSIIWSCLAIATGVTLLLSTAALFKSLSAKNYPQALFIAAGLVLCGTYSMVAAVGSATGQRMSASVSEDDTEKRRTAAQVAFDKATNQLALLPANRASGEVQAEIDGILLDTRLDGCREINGRRTRDRCPRVSELRKELARAEATEKDRLLQQSSLDDAKAQLTSLPAPKVVNSDAQSVVSLLASLGYVVTVAQVNTGLAILSVVLIEMGGSVSLAVGMALGGSNERFAQVSAEPLSKEAELPLSQLVPVAPAKARCDAGFQGLYEVCEAIEHTPFHSVRDRLLSEIVDNKAGLRSTYAGLGKRYGVSATRVGQVVRELRDEGVVRVRSSRQGTTITLASALPAIN